MAAHVRSVVKKVAIRQVSVQILQFFRQYHSTDAPCIIWGMDDALPKRKSLAPLQKKKSQLQGIKNIKSIVLASLREQTRHGNRCSSVSIVSDYGLDDRGSIPDRGRGFFL
jgi:hypothetical protein